MGRRTTFLAGTMIFWLPALFFTTYVGLYEAYKGAMSNDFLGLTYPTEFATMLIIPAMIPTIFSAHSILNQEKLTTKLIEKFNLFHSNAEDGHNENLEDSMLTSKEYQHLDFAKQLDYCRDLDRVGEFTLANKLYKQYFEKYVSSHKPDKKAAALYSKTLVGDGTVDQKEMYDSAEMAYALILDHPQSVMYQKIIDAYISKLPYIGYESGLKRLREIESSVSDAYLILLIEIKKLYFLYRMEKISEVDFESLENRIDFTNFNESQLDRLEIQIYRIKNNILLDKGDFEQLEPYLNQRKYRYKWNGKRTEILQNSLGRMYRKMGNYDSSLQCFNENLTRGRSKNLPMVEGIALVNLGKTCLLMGENGRVKELSMQSIEVFTKIDMARGLIESLTLFVKACEALGEDCPDELKMLERLEQEHGIVAQTN